MPEWREIARERLAGSKVEGAREGEILEELTQYLEDRYEDLRGQGFAAAEARRLAIEGLGQAKTLQRELRRAQQPAAIDPPARGGLMSSFLYDTKLAMRSLRKKPGFSLMVCGMLALGVAGNATIFSVFNGLFLKPLPFPHSERLVDLDETAPSWNLRYVGVSVPDYNSWRQDNRTFEKMAFFQFRSLNLSGVGAAQRVLGAMVTYDLLDTLGLQPALGRNFRPEEDKPGGAKVALLGYDLWQRVFQGDRQILGRVIRLSDQPYTVIGVLPREAVFPSNVELWAPLAADPNRHNGWFLGGIGRLKQGVTITQAAADLTRGHKARVEQKQANEHTSPVISNLRERYLGDFRTVSTVLLAGVAVVLLIACVNIASLMMVRASSRTHEIAIRTAIGATRGRVVRQLLTENLVLAAVGGVAGVLLGRLALKGLISMLPDVIPRWISFDLDVRFAIFCVLITGGATLLSGLLPALRTAGTGARVSLQESGTRTSLSRGTHRVLGGLVVVEVGLALALLISAALLLQAFRTVMHVDPGFRAQNVLTFIVSLPGATYGTDDKKVVFYKALLEELRKRPGVQSAGAATDAPLGGHSGYFFEAEGDRPRGPNEGNPVVLQVTATPGYFEAVGMTLLAGRVFDERDGVAKDAPVAMVNESFTKLHWPGKSPIGKRIRYGPKAPWFQIVGELRDERHYGLDKDAKPGVFIPYVQNPAPTMTIVLRAMSNPEALIGPAREAVRRMNGDLPMYKVATLTEQVSSSLWARRTYSWLFGAFAVVALALAAAGVYGVISYAVAQRTHEIGIRMALGAQPGRVLAQVLGGGMMLVAMGGALGIIAALMTARLIETLLFGVNPRDPWIYLAVFAGLACVGAAANLAPARRAASVDPMKALRVE